MSVEGFDAFGHGEYLWQYDISLRCGRFVCKASPVLFRASSVNSGWTRDHI
jgi:hypothetical protein